MAYRPRISISPLTTNGETPVRIPIEPGQRFGQLVVAAEAEPRIASDGRSHRRLLCECDCGGSAVVESSNLRTGNSTSCHGIPGRKLHGLRRIKEYNSWAAMKDRCLNPRSKRYVDYGGRGITVAPEWINDFAAFLAHVGRKLSPDLSIDRIDNNGDYEPGNVRWSSAKEQSNNRRAPRVQVYCRSGRHVLGGDNVFPSKTAENSRACRECILERRRVLAKQKREPT